MTQLDKYNNIDSIYLIEHLQNILFVYLFIYLLLL